MKTNLKLEVFASNKPVQECSFHIYDLVSANVADNSFKVIRSACRRISNYNSEIGIFENGKQIIATREIENIPNDIDFELKYQGEKILSLQENKKIYEEYIRFLIKENLKSIQIMDKYRKYACKSDITSCWFQDDQGNYITYECADKSIRLERAFKVKIEIRNDRAYLWLDTKSVFVSKLNVMDLMNKGMDVYGLSVKNEWSGFRQNGILTEICDYTVSDELDWGYSLKDYYVEKKKEAYRVKDIPDDTPVVKMQLERSSEIYPYYPQALTPIITREYMTRYDSNFSNQIDDLIKRNMFTRLETDREFITDIGELNDIGGLAFATSCCDPRYLGYKWGEVRPPQLLCGNGATLIPGNEYQLFSHGFFQKPDKQIKIGYLYPRGKDILLKQVANDIYSFAVYGKYHGQDDKYIRNSLMDIQKTPSFVQPYELGNITEYKRAALELRKCTDIDIVIALIPDGLDEESPYNPFKRVLAELNVPSQMITLKTARLFAWDAKTNGSKARYYLHNIVLGILGKTGGIPWILKEMPAGVDCFVGLDVAMMDKGIHYPACSVVFDRHGRMLGFFKPKIAQRGEKIKTDILQDIFDQVIISYEDIYGNKPKNIVIHRDGFNNEDAEWYEHYFKAQGINYSIIEVRKNISTKVIDEETEDMNPKLGDCVFNDKRAYLVSTIMKNKKGSPNPLLVEKSYGDISMVDAVTQVLYLTQLHVGSINKMRLPVTTGYADKICKNLDYVPEGQIENKLFFL